MDRIDVREQVRQALGGQWSEFAQRHPRLAAVLDEELLVEQATEKLRDDAEFQAALHQAEAMGAGMEALQSLVRSVVQRFLRELV